MSDLSFEGSSRLELALDGWLAVVAVQPGGAGMIRRLEWNGRLLAWSWDSSRSSADEPAPVLQEVRLDHLADDRPVLLGLGVSVRRHYSLSIEPKRDPTNASAALFEFDLAARGASGSLADTWVSGLDPTDLIDTGPSRIVWRLPEGPEVVLEVDETQRPSAKLAIGEAGRTGWLIQVVRTGETGANSSDPVTERLRYRWRLIP